MLFNLAYETLQAVYFVICYLVSCTGDVQKYYSLYFKVCRRFVIDLLLLFNNSWYYSKFSEFNSLMHSVHTHLNAYLNWYSGYNGFQTCSQVKITYVNLNSELP